MPQKRLHSDREEGRRVDNVTEANRYDVNQSDPRLKIALLSEGLSLTLHTVYIPRTREMPDAVIYRSEVFEVVDTTKTPPTYSKVMGAIAYDEPETTDKDG